MHSAWYVSYRISKWVIPKKYFVSFPHGMMDYWSIRDHRREMLNTTNNFFFTYEGKTVKDNLPIPFTMRGEDFIQCRRWVNKLSTREYGSLKDGETWRDLKKLPLNERWSARNFDLATVFEKVSEEDCFREELDWFYDLRDWQGYRAYLSSDDMVESPNWRLTKPHQLNRLCQEDEE
jgi:hypothetical protein